MRGLIFPQVMVKLVEAVAYNSCRHASTQFRKKSSTEVMLTNATEDFVPQFGDEVGGRYSSQ